MSEDLGITVKKKENFNEWYLEAVRKARLIDQRYPVKGCDVFLPNGFALWEMVQKHLGPKFKASGVKGVYFPLLIPEQLLRLEEEHFEGFSAEVPWVTLGGNAELDEKLAIRPTSETPMYYMFAKWVRSYSDLPFKINQWCNVMRWETKATRPFLRSREFLWQEGHTVHESEDDAEKQALEALEWYTELFEEEMAIPVLVFRRPEHDKFPGALRTYALDALMPNGRVLQMGTSHNLGQNFSRPFGIKFLSRENKEEFAWQTSWGVSTRTIGGLVMLHGDDNGVVIPPRMAGTQVVIVPIFKKDSEDVVLKAATELFESLKEFRVDIDTRDKTPGFKFADAELVGVPLRIEIGPRDVKENKAVLVRRDTGEKITVNSGEVAHEVKKQLEDMQEDMLMRAKKILGDKMKNSSDYEDLKGIIADGCVARMGWCGKVECAQKLKSDTTAEIRGTLVSGEVHKRESCSVCGAKSTGVYYAARQY